ncbi:MAG: sorbosone dehydrogenase family protein [Saprospiraceae bacterium]|nr:sorbosone dehydrogenase family protein [Saprospiraceae bacterium]
MRYSIFALLLWFSCTASSPKKAETAGPVSIASKASPVYTGKLPIDKIKLPPGFKIGVYAENLANARSLCLSPSGTLFVSTREKGNVYALRDTNGDYVADLYYTLASGLRMPNGVAFRNGSLFVAEISRILRFDDIENQLANPPKPIVVFDKYPTDEHHGWKYIAFGPDDKLYVPVGAPCNICEPENPIYCTITRLDVDNPREPEIVQRGIRNTVGFTWHPLTKELWFTDNGRDWLGDDLPACELNHAPKPGMHFGYPYCHQGDFKDPKFGDKRPCSDFTAPAQNLGAHVAPLGLEIYSGNNFPETYRHQVFIAEHGSWNRSKKSGYQISLVKLDTNGKSLSYEPFASGWLQPGESVWGRPVDLEHLPDGSLLISDDYGDAVYRIWYEGQ